MSALPREHGSNNVHHIQNVSSGAVRCQALVQLVYQGLQAEAKLVFVQERLGEGQGKGPNTLANGDQWRAGKIEAKMNQQQYGLFKLTI